VSAAYGSPYNSHAICYDQIGVSDNFEKLVIPEYSGCHFTIQGYHKMCPPFAHELFSSLEQFIDILVDNGDSKEIDRVNVAPRRPDNDADKPGKREYSWKPLGIEDKAVEPL